MVSAAAENTENTGSPAAKQPPVPIPAKGTESSQQPEGCEYEKSRDLRPIHAHLLV